MLLRHLGTWIVLIALPPLFRCFQKSSHREPRNKHSTKENLGSPPRHVLHVVNELAEIAFLNPGPEAIESISGGRDILRQIGITIVFQSFGGSTRSCRIRLNFGPDAFFLLI